MKRAIVFDFDMTLVDFYIVDRKAVLSIIENSINCIPKDEFYERSGEIIWEFYNKGIRFGDGIHKKRVEAILEENEISYKNEYLANYLKIYLNEINIFDDVEETLKELKKKYKLGLLTNSIDTKCQRRRIEISGLTKYFENICIAGEIGMYKPDVEAFYEIAERMNVECKEIIFIGDSEKHDIIGAKNAGMFAIKKDNGIINETKAEYRFSKYNELTELINKI